MEGGAKYVHSLAYLQLLPAVKEEKKMLGKYQQHCQRLSHLSLFYYAFNAFIINMIMLCVFFLLMLEYVLFNHVKKRKKNALLSTMQGAQSLVRLIFPFQLYRVSVHPLPSLLVQLRTRGWRGEACPQM